MRNKVVILMLGVLLSCGGLAQAGYVDIYEDTTINNDLVNTTVRAHDSANLTLLSGNVTAIELLNMSIGNVYGGYVIDYSMQDSSILNLYGGTFGDIRYSGNLVTINIYGQNFQVIPASGDHTSVFLQGKWLDGSTFDIYFRMLPQPFEQALGTNIFLIPEPATVSFLLFGLFGIRKLKH